MNPEAVLWDLANIRKIHGSVVTSRSLLNCHYCYSKLDFVRTDMVEQRCIPLRESNCLRFNFTDVHPPFQANSGYEAFMIVPNGTDLSNVTVNVLAVGKEEDASQTAFVGLDDPRCDATPPSLNCDSTHGEFILSLLFDGYPDETSWQVGVGNGVVVLEGGNYTEAVSDDSVVVQECLPLNTCLNFTIMDTFGDGLCCGNGYGEYVGFWEGQEVFRGGSFGSVRSHTFGSC